MPSDGTSTPRSVTYSGRTGRNAPNPSHTMSSAAMRGRSRRQRTNQPETEATREPGIGRIIGEMPGLTFVILVVAIGLLVLIPTRRLFLGGWTSGRSRSTSSA